MFGTANANFSKGLCFGLIVAAAILFCGSTAEAAVATFTHTDDNPYSVRNGQSVGPYDTVNNGTVTMWYNQYNKY